MSKTAFIFPGQGSQFAGMGRDLADNFSVAKQTFEEADDAIGFSLSSLCFNGPDEDLKLTANTQPAILTVSIAALRVVEQETDLKPDFCAGHSLGEYSALVAAGALSFGDAVRTVRARGTFMQEAVPVGVGAMAAMLGIDADVLDAICKEASQGEVVTPANYNSPGQVVIAGHATAVARALELAKGRGYRKAMLLPVSAPFHCALMEPAAARLSEVLEGLAVSSLKVPVVTNVEAVPNEDSGRVRNLLTRQVCAPVKWEGSMLKMVELGVGRFIELGPGKVLSGLVKRNVNGVEILNVEDKRSLESLHG